MLTISLVWIILMYICVESGTGVDDVDSSTGVDDVDVHLC